MKGEASPIWRVVVPADALSHPAFAQALDDLADSLSAFELTAGGLWRIEALATREPDRRDVAERLARAAASVGRGVPAWSLDQLPARDWLAENRRAFPPRRVGRFFVHASHERDTAPAGSLAIALDASIAFGSGEHATTQGCLLAIDRICRIRRPRRSLDLGCGSGILAVGLAKAGCRHVVAIDIDADAVRLTAENARDNAVAARVRAVRSARGPQRSAALAGPWRGPYDLVIANILARPLCRLAPVISRAAKRSGTLILSGLLVPQAPEVLAAYRSRRWRLRRRIARDGWCTLVLNRKSA